ncbi:MAG: hypothetical protein R3E79_38000 [Caldilineaceae bacterium]
MAALSEAEIEPEIPLLLAALHCYHGEMQARLGIHEPTRQTNLTRNLSTLRKLGSIAQFRISGCFVSEPVTLSPEDSLTAMRLY